jgi:hypothetical protein
VGASCSWKPYEVAVMMTVTASRRTSRHAVVPETERRATRVVVAALGALVGLAGVEHGIGEVLQGPVRPDGLFILSWPDAAALEILSGEPAMTLVPDLRITGVLAVVVGLAVAVWSIWFAAHRHGGLVLVGLSVLLLLVGGGLVPPVMGVALGAVASRMGRTSDHAPPPLIRAIAPAWPWFLAAALVGYLGLMPGMVVASTWGWASEAMVLGLVVLAFTGFVLTLVAARAYDRLHARDG